MRKGYDGLATVVTQALRRDPLSGDVFLFVNRTRKRAKVLPWDGTGLCIYAKRLERGRFACRWRDHEGDTVRLMMSELALFIEGSSLVGCMKLSPNLFVFESLRFPLDPEARVFAGCKRMPVGRDGRQ